VATSTKPRAKPAVVARPLPAAADHRDTNTDDQKKSPGDLHETIEPLAQTLGYTCPERQPLVEGIIQRGQIAVLGAAGHRKDPVPQSTSQSGRGGSTVLGHGDYPM
jgi:hypothetical protein